MKSSWKIGINFGITSGIITTLGLLVGLTFSSEIKAVVIGGILTIAIADAFSDALGIHISQEGSGRVSQKSIWQSTLATFVSKFIVAGTFLLPVIFLPLKTAVVGSVVWGLLVVGVLSWRIGKFHKENPWSVVREHLFITIVVVLLTYGTGSLIHRWFGA